MKKTRAVNRSGAILAVAAACAWPSGARADEGDVINFFAGASLTRDDNVFRLPEGLGLVPGAGFAPGGERSDSVRNLFAGATLDKTLGRQRLHGRFTANQVRYGRFDFLDYDGTDAAASWLWRIGNRWDGEARYESTKTLTAFDDFRAPVRNLTTVETARFGANYWFHPDWTLVAALDAGQGRNSTTARLANDFDRDAIEAGVRFGPATGNRIGLSLRRTDYQFPNRASGSTFGNDQTLYDIEGNGQWNMTGKSRLVARAGYRKMVHAERPERDFAAPTARIEYDWTPAGKSAINFALRREISSFETVSTSFIDTRAASISPSWTPSAKMRVQGRFEYRLLTYRGNLVAVGPQREDTGWLATLTATYAPWRFALLSLTLQHDRRDSNTPGLSYRDDLGAFSAQFQF
ncbi:MAG: hypothetical protein COW56_04285 [Rhodocyclales bacterium CG17_big_fil_post_rev_8_21_14_2_50_68_7]|nr:MAG: hypothetical protein COW56_04285 [Rhodocyclales bacterium CG17_big_fil_post_rev_8_21_14_2_50_68_7]